jgi:plasmid stabilization system protein ParE
MAEVIWSPRALQDIARLHRFLMDRNPAAASSAIRTIRGGARMLQDHPEAGRPMDGGHPAFREWLIPLGNSSYVMLYRVEDDRVVLLAIRHQREAGY